jgi:hypothetical protein
MYEFMSWKKSAGLTISGSLMSYGIGEAVVKTTTSIYPYQGIFLYLGAISLGCAPLVWYLLPNSPTTAKFLRHGNDRLIALERVRENNTGTKVSKSVDFFDARMTLRD